MVVNNFSKFYMQKPKPQNVAHPNTTLQAIWNDLPDETIR